MKTKSKPNLLRSHDCAEPGCDVLVHTNAEPPVYCFEHSSPTKRKRDRRAARRKAADTPPHFTGRSGPRVKKLPAQPAEPSAPSACDFLGAAEEILPIHECGHPGCNEIIGAELEFCRDHQPPPAFRKGKGGAGEREKGGDDRVNEAGVYVRGVETVRVPLSAGAKRLSAEVRVVEEHSGAWAAAWDEQHGVGSSGCAPSVSDQSRGGYPTRQAAILAMLDAIRARWNREEASGGTPKTWQRQLRRGIKDLDAFRAQFEAGAEPNEWLPPGMTGTTTPAGIARHDPDSVVRGLEKIRQGLATDDPRAPSRQPSVETKQIPLAELARNRFNARTQFDEAELAELAGSLATHGLVHAIVVRPLPFDQALPSMIGPKHPVDGSALHAWYEIAAGERRAMAAQRAGWETIRAEVRELTDLQMREIALVENDQRADLSAIDRARGYRRWLEETQKTQKELAAVVGRHHTTVSNTLALLDAPESWQKRVNAGQIPPTFVRHVLPYKDAPRVMETLEKRLDEAAKQKQPIETVADWQATVKDVVRDKSVRLVKTVHVSQPYAHAELRIDKTHPRYAELQVIDLDAGWRKEKRALNTQLANQILGEKAKAWLAKHGGQKSEVGGQKSDKAGVGKQAARLKAQQDREAHRRKLEEWLDDWKHFVCSQCLERSQAANQRLAMLLVAHQQFDGWNQEQVLDEVLDRAPAKIPRPKGTGNGSYHTPSRVWSIPEDQLGAMGRGLLAGLLWGAQRNRQVGPIVRLGRADVDLLCRELSIDFTAAWQQRVAGTQVFAGEPLTQAYWDLHTAEQLAELALEWRLWEEDVALELTLQDLGRLIDGTGRVLPLPNELAELIAPPPRKPRTKATTRGQGDKGTRESAGRPAESSG